MADLRLLIGRFAGVAGVAVLTACAPLYSPRLEGHLLDARTRAPVADAELFTGRPVSGASLGEQSNALIAQRWTTTDSDGHFVFERQLIQSFFPYWLSSVQPTPHLLLVDRRYGAFPLTIPDDEDTWTTLSFVVSPQAATLQYFEDRSRWTMLCSGWDQPACFRMCEIAYGPSPAPPGERVANYCELGAP